jgi:hypothetical protein
MRWSTLLVIAALHGLLSCAVFFGMMSSGLQPPDAPATPWQDAGLLAGFWILFLPSILLQKVGIDLWILALLMVPINTLIWLAAIRVVTMARAVRRIIRYRRQAG